MRWQTVVGLLLIAASGTMGWDLMQDSKNPWPAYAPPQAECGLQAPKTHDGAAIRFQYPDGWTVTETRDARASAVQTFLEPPGGQPHEVTLFLREMQSRLSSVEVPAPPTRPPGLRDAPADTPAASAPAAAGAAPQEPVKIDGTEQALQFGEDRNGSAYLTRLEDKPQEVSFSWMAFVWDKKGRSTVVSGPKLIHSNWPLVRTHDRKLNCAFWTVLKTLEAK